jgi:hypothetical protein
VKAQLNRLLNSWVEGLFLAVQKHRGRTAYLPAWGFSLGRLFRLGIGAILDKYSIYLFQNAVLKLRLSDKDPKSRLHNDFEIKLLEIFRRPK